MKLIIVCLISTSAAIFAAACNQSALTQNKVVAGNTSIEVAGTTPSPVKPDDETVSAPELYATNCMICHKDSGKGGKVTIEGKSINPDDLTSDKMAKKSDEKLYSYVADGSPDEGMPAFKEKLSDSEIKSLVAHLRKLQGK